MVRKIYLSLGANLGNRGETIRAALRQLTNIPQTKLLAVANFYETAPWGKLDQPGFINTAAVVSTELTPLELLDYTQKIEYQLGRVRHEHWGARTIDIDLLAADDMTYDEERLRLPHPYLTQRAFVLVPLNDIAPELVIKGKKIVDWCREPAIIEQAITPADEIAQPFPLQLIACVTADNGLGYEGDLVVKIAADMARFKALTTGQIVIMGRKTMESLPHRQPLPQRVNIVLSHSLESAPGFLVCHDLAELWQILGKLTVDKKARICWCIGGGQIYAKLLPFVSDAYITEVAKKLPADVFLPALTDFSLIERQDNAECAFCHYRRTILV